MQTTCAVSGMGKPIYRTLLASLRSLVATLLLFPMASAAGVVDVTTHIDRTGAVPYSVWAVMAVAGPLLLLYTVRTRLIPSELEADFVMSVAAWVPIAFTAYSSFKVDRIISSFMTTSGGIVENHLIYTFDIFGYGYGVLLLVAVVNTVRIVLLHRNLQVAVDNERFG